MGEPNAGDQLEGNYELSDKHRSTTARMTETALICWLRQCGTP